MNSVSALNSSLSSVFAEDKFTKDIQDKIKVRTDRCLVQQIQSGIEKKLFRLMCSAFCLSMAL